MKRSGEKKLRKWMLPMMAATVLVFSACAGGNAGRSADVEHTESAGGTEKENTENRAMGETAVKTGEVQKITAEDAKKMMDAGQAAVILDVRRPEEYAEGHVPGAVLLPNEEIGTAYPALLPVKDAVILVYCRSGRRSAEAAEKLAAMGYTAVYDFGGIMDWPYETEKGEWVSEKSGDWTSFRTWDLQGRVVDEGIFLGHKLTMVNIWGTFCNPCLQEMPHLGELAKEYEGQGVQVVGIVIDVFPGEDGIYDGTDSSSDGTISVARELVQQTGAEYTHLLPSEDLIRAKLSQVSSIPETIFIDENGRIVGDSYLGSRNLSAWESVVNTVLSQVEDGT